MTSRIAPWPPSAAVRQRSIALMTLIWPRLTWPALARRHAAPWSRKISATSRAGRDMPAGRSNRLRRLASLPGRPARLAQQVEWALDGGDHASGHPRVARCCVELVVTEESLNDADIGPTFEQMGRKTVAQRMQRHRLLDAGRVSRLVKQTIELPGRHRLSWRAAREQPALLLRHARIVASRSHLPPLSQQIERLWRQHDVTVFASLGLHDADDVLRTVDIANPEPDHLARAQPCAIAESEQSTNLESPRHGQQALGLVRAHHQRDLLGFFDVKDLGGKIQSPQRHTEQEPAPGHDAGAIANPCPRLCQVQLKQTDLVGRGRVGRALQIRSEPLAAADVASLRVRVEFARAHILDHALAQRADGIGTHGNSPE